MLKSRYVIYRVDWRNGFKKYYTGGSGWTNDVFHADHFSSAHSAAEEKNRRAATRNDFVGLIRIEIDDVTKMDF